MEVHSLYFYYLENCSWTFIAQLIELDDIDDQNTTSTC